MATYRQEDGAVLRSYSVMSLRQRGEDPPFDLAHERNISQICVKCMMTSF